MITLLIESALRAMILGTAIRVGLAVFQVRRPNVRSLVWTVALIAALAMPALIEAGRHAAPHWPSIAVLDAQPQFLLIGDVSDAPAKATVATKLPSASAASSDWRVDWLQAASLIYTSVAALLVVRLVTGLALTWRLRLAAVRIGAGGRGHDDIRLSPALTVPVTFGSTILLPAHASEWSARKREAVLAHERCHVTRGDSYVQFLAQLHRALFWFSPFAWWLADQLADLAESACDDRAVTELREPVAYAEILLDVARGARHVPAGVAMARSAKVGARIERILAGKVAAQLSGQLPLEVYPENDQEFFYTVVKAQLSFVRDDTGRVTQLVLHQNGQNQVAAKTD